MPRKNQSHVCPSDGCHDNGRCAGQCGECGTHLLLDGRYASYCPDCDEDDARHRHYASLARPGCGGEECGGCDVH